MFVGLTLPLRFGPDGGESGPDQEGEAMRFVRALSDQERAVLLAALKHLKLVQPLKGKKREHEPMDPQPFLDQVSKLMSSSVKPKTLSQ